MTMYESKVGRSAAATCPGVGALCRPATVLHGNAVARGRGFPLARLVTPSSCVPDRS